MSSSPLVLQRAVELCGALEAAGFAYALGGALALGYHVEEPRGTRDIDVNVTLDPGRVQELFAVLPADLPWTEADLAHVQREGQVRLRWPVEGDLELPVDLFLVQHELHRVVASRTELVPMLGRQVPVLSATDLTIFKALFDRGKDWADIEEMLRYGKVDEVEVERWLTELLGSDDARLGRLAELRELVRRPENDVVTTTELFRRRSLGD